MPAMRRAILGFWTYAEFFGLGILLLPAFLLVAARYGRRDPSMRARGKMMRFYGWLSTVLSPIWNFDVTGAPPDDIHRAGYVAVCNHASSADPFLLTHLPFAMRFI